MIPHTDSAVNKKLKETIEINSFFSQKSPKNSFLALEMANLGKILAKFTRSAIAVQVTATLMKTNGF